MHPSCYHAINLTFCVCAHYAFANQSELNIIMLLIGRIIYKSK